MTISAKIIADSITNNGKRITTYELEYPRFVHAEFLTHRLFSRNAASSRAIPVEKAIGFIQADTAMPIHWGKNQPGMSAKEECNETHKVIGWSEGDILPPELTREDIWNLSRDSAIGYAKTYVKLGYHKQIVNRLLEPYSHIKVVLTTTEDDNFLWLRKHPDAQPEIHELASVMYAAKKASLSMILNVGSWHVPYYQEGQWTPSSEQEFGLGFADFGNVVNASGESLADALAVSSSCAAQVSYRRLDDSVEKARAIYQRLVSSLPPHFSPFEHQATPMPADVSFYNAGVTHYDRYGNYWSGNFSSWIQHRQLIMNDIGMDYMTSKPPTELLGEK